MSSSEEFGVDRMFVRRRRRHELERAKLGSAFSTIAVELRDGLITEIAGSIELPSGRDRDGTVVRDFRIVVPPRYPSLPPRAYAVGWRCEGQHRYGDTEMCLWQTDQWTARHSLAYAVGKTFTWIQKHELFLADGVWPGRQQRHG